jgi:hypothetical protein
MDELSAEMWADQQFSDAQSYLTQRDIRTTGILTLAWLAAPYLVLWTARSTTSGLLPVWVVSGQVPTDYVLEKAIQTPRDAIRVLGERWKNIADHPDSDDAIRTLDFEMPPEDPGREEARKKLDRFARTLLGVAEDDSLWKTAETDSAEPE